VTAPATRRACAQPGKGWTDKDESRWPVPYWYIDTGFTALLILLAVVDEGLGAVFFGIAPEIMASFRARYGVLAEWTPNRLSRAGYPGRTGARLRALSFCPSNGGAHS
jgi:hypothetical protein